MGAPPRLGPLILNNKTTLAESHAGASRKGPSRPWIFNQKFRKCDQVLHALARRYEYVFSDTYVYIELI